MSGEGLIVRGALAWGALAVVPAAGVAYALRGEAGAASVALAAGIVLANAALAAGLSVLAGRISTTTAAMISLPSFAFRMMLVFGALAWLRGQSFIDRPAFALSFGTAVMVVVALEARGWKRTPWLATTFGAGRSATEDGT